LQGTKTKAVAHRSRKVLVVDDLSLHDITGLDLARRLREASSSRRPYLIALTAFGNEVMREVCLAAGFDAYLLKTADIQALEALLEQ